MKPFFSLLLLIALSLLPVGASAQERLSSITVMADSNLSLPLSRLARNYARDRGTAVSIAMTGNNSISTQIADGAAADVLITARNTWLAEHRQQGLVDVYSEAVLLKDRLALAAPDTFLVNVDLSKSFPTAPLINAANGNPVFALGHPEHAPEAAAVRQSLKKLGADADLEPYTVYPESTREILRMVKEQGAFAILPATLARQNNLKVLDMLPEDSHDPIEYRAVVLAGDNMDEARRFIEFLKLPGSQKVLQEF